MGKARCVSVGHSLRGARVQAFDVSSRCGNAEEEQTNFPPDSFNALKPVEAQPERLQQGRTSTDLDPKFYYSPYQTNFILGPHDHGPMDTDADGERWANAGFNFVSVPPRPLELRKSCSHSLYLLTWRRNVVCS